MHEHVLDSLLQRDARTGTPDARPCQLDRDQPGVFLEIAVVDVSTVFLDRRPNAILDEFLDHRHDLVVVLQNGRIGDLWFVQKHLVAGGFEEIHQNTKDFRPHVLPLGLCSFRYGDKISSKVDGLDAINFEQILGQWRLENFFDRIGFLQKMSRSVFVVQNNRVGRKEFDRFGIWCVFCLNENGSNLNVVVVVVEQGCIPKVLRWSLTRSWLLLLLL
mmetsp:Transcript_4817/g.10619  ORF Transcript_4817/g.10619 Transcript_4817/m.10619 type:complete len:217 (+) Transcript_4817:629-1279(+)